MYCAASPYASGRSRHYREIVDRRVLFKHDPSANAPLPPLGTNDQPTRYCGHGKRRRRWHDTLRNLAQSAQPAASSFR